ncbi:MAG: hypothetical protein JWN08_772 [Frankiales bacterium]|jgi:hypothetical protein|nr:hypothetical protein [Frankiales bacterium]
MDTPTFDGVLADRLAAARTSVERAGRDAAAFRTALDAGQAQALEELARQRAEQLASERTAALTARVTELEQQLDRAHAQRAADLPVEAEPAEAEPAEAQAVEAQGAAPGAGAVADHPAVGDEPTVPAEGVPAAAVRQEPTPPPTGRPVLVPRPPLGRPSPGRASDQGPTGTDVPSVPSMKDIFASTRAAGWLDSLLGAKK